MQNLINMQSDIDRKNAKENLKISETIQPISLPKFTNFNFKPVDTNAETVENKTAVLTKILEQKNTKFQTELEEVDEAEIEVKNIINRNEYNIENNLKNPEKSAEDKMKSGDLEEKILHRRKKILVLLVKGGLSLRDISDAIGHVTDKTILRDMQDLMIERKVFKVGDKRWTKYYLK
jgi:hypothetical protein